MNLSDKVEHRFFLTIAGAAAVHGARNHAFPKFCAPHVEIPQTCIAFSKTRKKQI